MSSTTSVSLINMPDLALKEIFANVGWRSLHTLRLVSKDLCNYIDIVKPKIYIENLRIKLTLKSVQIELNSSFRKSRIEIHNQENSTFTVSEKKKICHGPQLFLSVAMEILKPLLKRQNGPIGKFQLEVDDKYSQGINEEFLEKLLELLESLRSLLPQKKSLLQVNQFDLEGNGLQAFQLLPRLESEFLKKINISRAFTKVEGIRNNDLMMLKQWKNAEELRTFGYYFYVPIQEFVHFNIAEFHITDISGSDLTFLKKVYSSSQTFKSSTIHYSHLLDPKDLEQILGEPFQNNEKFNEKTCYIRMAIKGDYVYPVINFSGKLTLNLRYLFNIKKKCGTLCFKKERSLVVKKSNVVKGCNMDIQRLLDNKNEYLDNGALIVECGVQVEGILGTDGIWMFNFHDELFECEERQNMVTCSVLTRCDNGWETKLYCHKQLLIFHSSNYIGTNHKLWDNHGYGIIMAYQLGLCLQIAHGVQVQLDGDEYIKIMIMAQDLNLLNVIHYCEQHFLRLHNSPSKTLFKDAIVLNLRHLLTCSLEKIEYLEDLVLLVKEMDIDEMPGESMKMIAAKIFKRKY